MPIVTISLGGGLLRQCGKPTGWFGRLMLQRMNRSHSELTRWGLTHVEIQGRDTILDVGCGGGRTVGRLASIASEGRVVGVDYSGESIAVSRRTNRHLIDEGRVVVLRAAVSNLPFRDATFDLVTAVETHYYWPDLHADMQEIRRVLRPGGALAVFVEAYKGGRHDQMLEKVAQLRGPSEMKFTLLTASEHRELLVNAGYSDVRVVEAYEKGWLCAVGCTGAM